MILRFGKAGALMLAVFIAAAIGCAGWSAFGMIAIVAGLLAGAGAWILARSYVEIVTIVTEMLVPH